MTVVDYLGELVRPFTDSSVLVGMLVFAGLLILARAAGLTGLWLGIVVVPAFSRFLVRLAEARVAGRPMQPMGISLFGLINNIWALLPLALIGLSVLAAIETAERFGLVAAGTVAAVAGLMIPASVGALALTHAPEAALNPLALWELVRRCGTAYLMIPVTLLAGSALAMALVVQGAPSWLLIAALVYGLSLLFSLTGHVVALSGIRDSVGAEDPAPSLRDKSDAELERERGRVLNHAYGLFSRGNSDGGIAHIEDFVDRIAQDVDGLGEYDWFFRKALEWESRLPGLRLGQRYLSRLLDAGARSDALKTLSRCLHEDERFQPLPADRERLRALAESTNREDLLRFL